jgi:predicted regulator of Ras-like GTPase activity (Roadblock/LC7/MglB family)
MDMSVFGVALEAFSKRHAQVEIAILYDTLGETIDYYSCRDPFVARLAAAHHGLIFGSAQSRLAWLKLGKVDAIEICATHLDSLTLEIGDGVYLTIVVTHASVDSTLSAELTELASELRKEAGF